MFRSVRDNLPPGEWDGPFRITVPMLGDKTIEDVLIFQTRKMITSQQYPLHPVS